MTTNNEATSSERRALGLYVVLSRDTCDFIDMVQEEQDTDALKTLYKMLILKQPDLSTQDSELNDLGARLLGGVLDRRNIPRPTLPEST